MQTTTALRLYGKRDLRLETFDLPEMRDDEILASVVTDSLCLSSRKRLTSGENHKKVPDDVATNPIIIGHEFCGDIIAVGKNGSISFSPASAMSFRLTCNCRIARTVPATPSRGWAVKPRTSSFLMKSWSRTACWPTKVKPILKVRWLSRYPA